MLLVSQSGVSTREDAKSAVGMLDKVGARIIGVVVWGVGGDKSSSYIGGAPTGYVAYYAAHPKADAATVRAATNAARAPKPATPGRLVAAAGRGLRLRQNEFVWNTASVPAGVYIVRLTLGGRVFSRRLVIMK